MDQGGGKRRVGIFRLALRGELVTLLYGQRTPGSPAMTTPEKEPPIEERIGNMIGKIFCLFLFAFLIWGYWTAIAANFGLFR
jgi:hypothetical protein